MRKTIYYIKKLFRLFPLIFFIVTFLFSCSYNPFICQQETKTPPCHSSKTKSENCCDFNIVLHKDTYDHNKKISFLNYSIIKIFEKSFEHYNSIILISNYEIIPPKIYLYLDTVRLLI
jgi:hypothetical protein